jgi:ArsR family transcriptional regulator, arsenate/arsenite/antimonite-responsive transcriptional repressor
METELAVVSLAALAHPSRLEAFRVLVRRGEEGMPAGELASRLGVAPPTLSFHLQQLRHAGLIRSRRRAREVVYSANYDAASELVRYLTENCCAEGSCG